MNSNSCAVPTLPASAISLCIYLIESLPLKTRLWLDFYIFFILASAPVNHNTGAACAGSVSLTNCCYDGVTVALQLLRWQPFQGLGLASAPGALTATQVLVARDASLPLLAPTALCSSCPYKAHRFTVAGFCALISLTGMQVSREKDHVPLVIVSLTLTRAWHRKTRMNENVLIKILCWNLN